MVIEDSHLFVILMSCYIYLIECQYYVQDHLMVHYKYRKLLSLTFINNRYLVFMIMIIFSYVSQ